MYNNADECDAYAGSYHKAMLSTLQRRSCRGLYSCPLPVIMYLFQPKIRCRQIGTYNKIVSLHDYKTNKRGTMRNHYSLVLFHCS